jgi:hypothetical protein
MMMLRREPWSAPLATTIALEVRLAEFYPRLVPRRRDPENGTSADTTAEDEHYLQTRCLAGWGDAT